MENPLQEVNRWMGDWVERHEGLVGFCRRSSRRTTVFFVQLSNASSPHYHLKHNTRYHEKIEETNHWQLPYSKEQCTNVERAASRAALIAAQSSSRCCIVLHDELGHPELACAPDDAPLYPAGEHEVYRRQVGRPLQGRLHSTNNNHKKRRCRGSNPGHPRDRREYSPLYYNDVVGKLGY